MTNYQKILTSRFGNLAITVVKTGQSEPGVSRQQLGEMLGYDNPTKAIKDIHVRNAARFDGGAKCALVKMPDSLGREQETARPGSGRKDFCQRSIRQCGTCGRNGDHSRSCGGEEERRMITIPLNSNSGIRILAKQTEQKPERKQIETIERIGVSIQEGAKMLGISKPHFLPLIKEGKIRTVKIGRRILVSVQSLREFIDGKVPNNSTENGELQGKK
jgi:excisionase family DNA binding protein